METQTMTHEKLEITIQPTPNPNALKFILSQDVMNEGKISFKSPQDCREIPLAASLFDLRGVDQIHFFQNVITISKFSFEDWNSLEPAVQTCIENFIEDHNPNIKVIDPETINYSKILEVYEQKKLSYTDPIAE